MEMNDHTNQSFERIKSSVDTLMSLFSTEDEDDDLQDLANAIRSTCFKPSMFSYVLIKPFKLRKLLTEIQRLRVLRYMYEEHPIEWEDSDAFYRGHRWTNELPNERIVRMFLRAAKEPPVCPRCGEVIGGAVNEVWIVRTNDCFL